ncbi:hypothetical protein RL72_00264 [Microbacterium azadirachtae]|uniref:Uncharacterized protein n=1 Tax=Microbacterium azadirachtae TaxID=582680 RepID=A0A0F0LAG4_9MICO|nr:hypothetical protein RL72_00264 [Microbacterium azadirachtae]
MSVVIGAPVAGSATPYAFRNSPFGDWTATTAPFAEVCAKASCAVLSRVAARSAGSSEVGRGAVRATTADGSATQVETAGTVDEGVPAPEEDGPAEGGAVQPASTSRAAASAIGLARRTVTMAELLRADQSFPQGDSGTGGGCKE